ncbi:deoxyribonuclease IV [Micromonospora mirobrigensis]|uniref:Probable endonuclease 4 n=1 Tax=Micromonospora mirobrigensis TaxID=262898 RepID=A0A1C5A7L0_9ACTN|nr:deoxyribonuclease IV [Micromonospora mirobrigensis]SCF41185.1 Endonuclease IV [Micromonospora mirobrigensis]
MSVTTTGPVVPAARRAVGSHTPTSGGLARAALPYLDAAGSRVVQVYVSNSRGWALPPGDPAQDVLFRDGCGERGVPVYIHASLLVNLGSPTGDTVRRSAETLAHALGRGAAIGAAGVVFHAGSAVDAGHAEAAMRQLRETLLPLLDAADAAGGPMLLVEPSAGGGRSLASRVEQLGPYLDAVDRHPMLGVCFDTCHAWAAGHDLAAEGGMTATLDTLVATVGPGRLKLVHANDSKDLCGSTRDRHENIGKGSIGEPAFAELMRHPATEGVPIVVETPTEKHEGHGTDIATLNRLHP